VKHPKTLNVLFVATVSAILNGVLAGIFIPLLCMVMLSLGALPGPLAAIATAEHGMMFAVAAPFAYGAVGFFGGALMAFLFNRFVLMLDHHKPPTPIVIDPELEAESMAVGEAA
jgi:hypothetical protein